MKKDSTSSGVTSTAARQGFPIIGFALVIILSAISWWITNKVYVLKLPFGIPGKALEFPLWAAIIGLSCNGILKVLQLHDKLRDGFRTELFLKIGLVLLGAGISFKTLATAAGGSILQSIIMISAVFLFCWWVAGKFGLDDKLRAVMASAASICGVSAAIAAAGSVQAKKEQVTYIATLVIITALPLMVISPILARFLGLPEEIAGAWFGGNIDTTAAVVGAGTIYGETAQKIATIVKSTQNALMGIIAFLLALYFATVVEGNKQSKPSVKIIWERFPKFVLGFVVASVLFSFGVIDGGKGTAIEATKNWMFTFAFVCMGLELSVRDVKSMGWRPVTVFFITTLFNTILALIVAWFIFGSWFPITK